MTNSPLDPSWADELIEAINAEHLYRLRQVRGRDLNDWHEHLHALAGEDRHDDALELLDEIMDCTLTLVQYDAREPDLYWWWKASALHRRLKDNQAAARVLERWLAAWPEARAIPAQLRPVKDRQRARVRERLKWLREQH